MAKNSKSKRFSQISSDAVKKHDERFPYRSRYSEVAENESDKDYQTPGGF